jgi:hypothetical protein
LNQPYYVNQTGTLEQHKAFVKQINELGPYFPDTEKYLITKTGHHVKFPDGTVVYNLSPQDAENWCFKLNLAHLKGQEEWKLKWDALKSHLEKMDKDFGPHEEHEKDKYQCGVCDGYCDIKQEMEKLEKGL